MSSSEARAAPEIVDVDRYLDRIGFRGSPAVDLESLEALQRAHMTAVPFENLDVYRGASVDTDVERSLRKIVEDGRGGWCFELNGAFAALLEALGFAVTRLGAAVLLAGPTDIVDHLCLEVRLSEPYLVDVGFGDGFCRPLAVNRIGPQDGGCGSFELIASPRGTTLTRQVDGVPRAQYRFTRVARAMPDFGPASQRLQNDKTLVWHGRAFATRLLDGGPDRVTLVGNRLKLVRAGSASETPVADDEWSEMLRAWFGVRVPVPGGPTRTTA